MKGDNALNSHLQKETKEVERKRKIMERPRNDLFLGKPCVNTANVIAKDDKLEPPCPLSVSPSLSLDYLQNSMILFGARIPFVVRGEIPLLLCCLMVLSAARRRLGRDGRVRASVRRWDYT